MRGDAYEDRASVAPAVVDDGRVDPRGAAPPPVVREPLRGFVGTRAKADKPLDGRGPRADFRGARSERLVVPARQALLGRKTDANPDLPSGC